MKSLKEIEDKLPGFAEAVELRNQWKKQGLKVVFTNGCFDLIHLGHIDYLSKAAGLGDKLMIGLNSDASVRKIKGKNRPLNDEKTRLYVMASFSFTDAVVLFDEDTPDKLIRELLPDILVKGGDYREDEIVGAEVVKKNGGRVIILPFLKGYSTTAIEEKIKKGV
jgi:D-glycero-beta-D-manno-heptose 1-phosphate adenylyltransferase